MIYKPRHFILEELICRHVYDRYGQFAWRFFDERLLMTIDFIRDQLGAMYVNNWDSGGKYDERGLRCTECSLVQDSIARRIPYCSAHLRAQATDFTIARMKPEKVRLWIVSNSLILPFPIRVEKNTPTWVHIDVCNSGTNKVELFNP